MFIIFVNISKLTSDTIITNQMVNDSLTTIKSRNILWTLTCASSKKNYHHVDGLLNTGSIGSCQNDTFQCKHQEFQYFFSVIYVALALGTHLIWNAEFTMMVLVAWCNRSSGLTLFRARDGHECDQNLIANHKSQKVYKSIVLNQYFVHKGATFTYVSLILWKSNVRLRWKFADVIYSECLIIVPFETYFSDILFDIQIFIERHAFENVVWKMSPIIFPPQYV